MAKRLATFLLLWMSCFVNAQRDSILFDPSTGISDRIYVSYEAFRNNYYIDKGQIVSCRNKELPGFMNLVLDSASFVFLNDTEKVVMNPQDVWGFFQNGVFHLNYKGKFCRVTVFGSLSYFVFGRERLAKNVEWHTAVFGTELEDQWIHSNTFNECIFDFSRNVVLDYNLKNVKRLLSRDNGIYSRFMACEPEEQKQKAMSFIKQFNHWHSVFVLK